MKENIEMEDLEKVEIYGIKLPIMEKPFNLAEKIVEKAEETGVGLRNGDIIVVTSKIVLKSKGLLIDLERVKPGVRAKIISKLTGKDPVETQIILDNSKKIYEELRREKSVKERLEDFRKDWNNYKFRPGEYADKVTLKLLRKHDLTLEQYYGWED